MFVVRSASLTTLPAVDMSDAAMGRPSPVFLNKGWCALYCLASSVSDSSMTLLTICCKEASELSLSW